jgi:hypothetical protein
MVWSIMLAGAAILAAVSPARGATLTVGSATLLQNQQANLDVSITGVSNLFGFQFGLTFDPTVVQVVDVTEGSFLSSFCTGAPPDPCTFFSPPLTIDNATGIVDLLGATLAGADVATGSGVLATLTVRGVGPGTSGLTLTDPLLLLLTTDDLVATAPEQTVSGVISVEGGDVVVPEPATMVLTLLGFGAAALRRVAPPNRSSS